MFVQIIAQGPKMALFLGSNVLHRLIKGKHEKIYCLKPQDLET